MVSIFVSMPFDTEGFEGVLETIKYIGGKLNHKVIRIDEKPGSFPIISKIFDEIRNCKILVADLTGKKPNVLHEVGIAQGLGKPIVLISQDESSEAPFNVSGIEIRKYSIDKLNYLSKWLNEAFLETTSTNESIRSMLVPSSLGKPSKDSKFIIAASPLSYRRAIGRSGGYKKLRSTSSDYVGIRGILQTFGTLYGFETLPDMVDPEDCDDMVLQEKMNLYCIGSPKANHWTSMVLKEFQNRWIPKINFRADPLSKNLRNVKVSIFKNDSIYQPDDWKNYEDGDRYYKDYGIILRGPNPFDDRFMISIIAGRSSLGTEAASLAITSPKIVHEINKRLIGYDIDIEEHTKPFIALVKMDRTKGDGKEEANPDTLELAEVNGFKIFIVTIQVL